MAYYDALIAKWATLSPGTTQQKLDAVNAATAVGPAKKMIVPTYVIYNAIVPSEFVALSAATQQLVRDVLSMGTVDVSPGTSARTRIVTAFPSGTQTFTALQALAATYDSPSVNWAYANNYPSFGQSGPGNLSAPDLLNAGLS